LIPLPDGGHLPGFGFLPDWHVKYPLPAVIVGAGVGSHLIPQYHDHCQHIANRGFAVVLIDPSNYPEALFPGPFSWDRGLGYAMVSFNQVVVAARLFFDYEWYLKSIRATVDFLCSWSAVDPTRIAFSGHSQPANAALTYACRDPRIRAIVWNYGGSPWIMPYNPMRLPPVQIFHGDIDEVYDVKYAMQLAMNLKSHMRCCDVNIYPGQKHLFNVYYDPTIGESRASKPALLDAFERLISFLNQVLAVYYR
jgi:dienelactone hydrolase